jgi:uncharacterized protein (DUF2062 family)
MTRMQQGPLLRRFQPWFEARGVFKLHREALARGAALGVFCGLIPGPLQIAGTFATCAWLRGNVIAGALATCYTNPLTIGPLYIVAFQLGQWLLPGDHPLPQLPAFTGSATDWFSALWNWIQTLGLPLAVGLPLLALVLATLTYATVQLLWLWPLLRRRYLRH